MAVSKRDRLRVELVRMLEADRRLAIKERNPSASLAATVRLAELLLTELAAADEHPQIGKIVHRLVYSVVCPVCKERQPDSATPPLPEPEPAPPMRAASGWDDPDFVETEPEPAPSPAPVVELKTVEVPRLESLESRDYRRNHVRPVRGLA